MHRLFVMVAVGLLTAGLVLYGVPARAAVDRFLESIDYLSSAGHAVVRINFSERVTYREHFPDKTGNTIEIKLQLFSLDSSTDERQFGREVMLAPFSKIIPLAGVTQESVDPAYPTLTVRFSRTVNYSISVAPGNQSVLIQLPGINYSETGAQPTVENRRISALEDKAVADIAEQARRLVVDARAALEAGDFPGAMMKSGQALNLPDHPHRVDAEEIFVAARRGQQKEADSVAAPKASVAPAAEATDEAAQLADARAALDAGQWEAATRILTLLTQTATPAVAKEASVLLESAKNKKRPPAAATTAAPAEQAATKAPSPTPTSDTPDAQARALLDRANAAMAAGELDVATKLYADVIALPANIHTKEAERLLRTARGAQAQSASEDLTGLVIGDPQTIDDVKRLMEEGELALRRGDNNRAIVIYSKIIELPEHELMPDALEFLGVARQRNNQVARAKSTYEDYLKKYPEGQGTDRVRQRLAEIVAASLSPKQAPREKARDEKRRIDKFLSWSQTYNWGLREVPVTEEGDTNTPIQPGQADTVTEEDQSVLISYLAGNMRIRSGRYDIRSVINGTHQKNFLEGDDRDRFLLNQMYVDFNDREKRYQLKAGRQSGTISGTLGRFDGVMAGYDLMPKLRINGAIGFPVDLSRKDTIDFDTKMYVANMQFKDVLPQVDFIPFVSIQTVDNGELDRAAVGEEIRFFNQRGTVFHVLDYDTLYQELNLFYVQGQLNLTTQSAIYSTFDYRASPFYSLRSALYNPFATGNASCGFVQGESIGLSDLKECYSIEDIRDYAADQTGYATSFVVGVNHSFSEKLQVSGDVTWANLAYSPAQIDASILDPTDPASEPTLPESEDTFTYGGRITTTGILSRAEITIFSLTYTDSKQYNETQFLIQNRAPFFDGWRVDTEFRANFRTSFLTNSAETEVQDLRRLRPAIKLVYDWRGKWSVEAEVGGEWSRYDSNVEDAAPLADETRYFGTVGYRLNF